MRIGLLHYTYAPVIGGVERVIDDLQSLFRSNGHEVELIGPHHPLRSDSAPPETLPHVDVLLVHNVMTMPFDLPLRTRLNALAERATFCKTTRLVNWVHDVASLSTGYASLTAETRLQLNQFRGRWTHVAVSASVAETFHRATGILASVIPNGIDPSSTLQLTERVAALAERHRWWTASLALLLPARIVPRKRIEDAIRLVEALNSRNTSADLLITGALDPHITAGSPSANYAELLSRRIAASPIKQRIHLLSKDTPLSSEDMTSLYQVCDAVILPSESEGFGLPALESALHGKPFLCNAIHPLQSLPGSVPLDIDSPNSELAITFVQNLAKSPALRARKSVLSEHCWQSIYERFIAPVILAAN
jgi:glycosyltransferase involved in cell wall biosynthesis